MGVMKAEALAATCRRLQQICQKYDQSVKCDVADSAQFQEYAQLHKISPPKEDQVAVTVNLNVFHQIDVAALQSELEEQPEVWRVFLTSPETNSLS